MGCIIYRFLLFSEWTVVYSTQCVHGFVRIGFVTVAITIAKDPGFRAASGTLGYLWFSCMILRKRLGIHHGRYKYCASIGAYIVRLGILKTRQKKVIWRALNTKPIQKKYILPSSHHLTISAKLTRLHSIFTCIIHSNHRDIHFVTKGWFLWMISDILVNLIFWYCT